MSVERKTTADVTMLKIDGDLSGTNAEELRSVASACLAEGRRDYVIDLADAHSCDSTGLEALTWLQRESENRLGLVRLCGVSETFAKILEITKLSDRFADHSEAF